jgi:hypothetical protein
VKRGKEYYKNVHEGEVTQVHEKSKLENGTKFTKKWMGQTFRFKI